MEILETLYHEIVGFFNFSGLIEIIETGNYKALLTQDGIGKALGPLIPVLLLVEIIRALFYRRLTFTQYKISFFTYVFNRFISRFISIGMVGLCIAFLG